MSQRVVELGGLTCRIVSRLPEGVQPRLIAVLCHGFGAPGTDLVGIGEELFNLRPELVDAVEFIFPTAPLSLDQFGMFGGRAWWHIDMEELIGAIEHGNIRILRERRPEGIDEARDLMLSLLENVRQRSGLPLSQMVLGGFSQGSMLAVETALNLAEPPGGLCLWSGTLVSEEDWRPKASRLKGVSVLQSHGRQDQILPFDAALWLRDLLVEAGTIMDFIPFNGPHTIPLAGLEHFADMLVRQCRNA